MGCVEGWATSGTNGLAAEQLSCVVRRLQWWGGAHPMQVHHVLCANMVADWLSMVTLHELAQSTGSP